MTAEPRSRPDDASSPERAPVPEPTSRERDPGSAAGSDASPIRSAPDVHRRRSRLGVALLTAAPFLLLLILWSLDRLVR
jgi:hypothetical protein